MTTQSGGTSEQEVAARHQLAHDLKSPIRAIAIYADLMSRAAQAPVEHAGEIAKYCAGLVEAAEELATHVDGFAEGDAR